MIAVTDCYSFILTQDGSSEAETDATSDLARRFSLCVDSEGIPIYGTASYKIDCRWVVTLYIIIGVNLFFCRKFVHCAPGIEVVADCPSGLLYNEAIKVCDYPRQANCVEFKASDDTKLVIAENLIEWWGKIGINLK